MKFVFLSVVKFPANFIVSPGRPFLGIISKNRILCHIDPSNFSYMILLWLPTFLYVILIRHPRIRYSHFYVLSEPNKAYTVVSALSALNNLCYINTEMILKWFLYGPHMVFIRFLHGPLYGCYMIHAWFLNNSYLIQTWFS